jgi:hypothetical protein
MIALRRDGGELMTHCMSFERDPEPTTPRLRRLMLTRRRAEASVEREPELLPAICPRCQSVLGLVVAGGAILCRDCRCWAPASDDLGADAGMLSDG